MAKVVRYAMARTETGMLLFDQSQVWGWTRAVRGKAGGRKVPLGPEDQAVGQRVELS